MKLAIVVIILIVAMVAIGSARPARAAMEPEEIMVRLATHQSLKGTAYQRRLIRKHRRGIARG